MGFYTCYVWAVYMASKGLVNLGILLRNAVFLSQERVYVLHRYYNYFSVVKYGCCKEVSYSNIFAKENSSRN